MANQNEINIPENFYNPSDSARLEMLRRALTNAGRPEDYNNVVQLLSPPPDIMNYALPGEFKGLKIGIIGGGLSGFSAAFELRKLGADITIYDALDHRIGGRVYTYYFDEDKKFYGEFGPKRIPVSHQTTWHYINLFGLNTQSIMSRNSKPFIYVHNTRLRREPSSANIMEKLYPLYNLSPMEQNTPWPRLHSYAFEYILKNMTQEVRSELLRILPIYSTEYVKFATLSNREAFEYLGLSQGAINLIAGVDPITGALLNTSYGETLQETYSVDFTNLYRIIGGMTNLPLAFYYSLTSSNPKEYKGLPKSSIGTVSIHYGHVVKGIYKQDEGKKVCLKIQNSIDKEKLEQFDYVICAIPFSTLREVEITPYFSNQKMMAIRDLNYADSLKALFFCNQRFWEEDMDYGRINGGVSFTDLPILSIMYPSDHILCSDSMSCSPAKPGVITSAYNFDLDSVRLGNQNKLNRFNQIKRNVEEVHGLPPGYLDTIVQNYKVVHWNTQPWFRGAFAYNLPGQKINYAYAVLQPEFDNRIFFAGEHTSVKHGWMQGALYSGKLAANTLAYYKKRNELMS